MRDEEVNGKNSNRFTNKALTFSEERDSTRGRTDYFFPSAKSAAEVGEVVPLFDWEALLWAEWEARMFRG